MSINIRKISHRLTFVMTTTLLMGTTAAYAMPVTATDTVALSSGGVYMSGTGITSYTFDINSYLGSGFSTPYNLSNVSILASFMDDQSDGITRSNVGTPGSYAWTSGPDFSGGGTQRRTATADYTEDQETATLSAGTSSYNASTTASNGGSYTQSNLDSSTGIGYHSGSCSWGHCSIGYYDSWLYKYTDYTGPLTGYNGAFNINTMIDATALADLQADGMLSVDIYASMGDFNLQSLSLTFTASMASAQSTAGTGAPLPEPGNMALLGMGLLGMAAYRRRRKS